jgi:hypothetical protein
VLAPISSPGSLPFKSAIGIEPLILSAQPLVFNEDHGQSINHLASPRDWSTSQDFAYLTRRRVTPTCAHRPQGRLMLRKFPCVLVARSRSQIPWRAIAHRHVSHGVEGRAESQSPESPLPPFQVQELKVSSTLEGHEEREATERQGAESLEPLADFAVLGIRRSVRLALHEAFPSIRTPTACQTAFIPAIFGRKDVILKDWTGTGK